VDIATEDGKAGMKFMKFAELTPYTCPECHGVLSKLEEGGRLRFRCHTGHAFSQESLLANISENIEDSLWNAIRAIEENIMLLNHLGDHFAEHNQPKLAAMYFKKAKESNDRAGLVRQAVMHHEQLTSRNIRQQADKETQL
jgi:two-component system chemotaxis response regulator CheB